MPSKFAKLTSTGFCLLMVLLAARQAQLDSIVQPLRGPASVSSKPDKMSILKPRSHNGFIHTEKVRGPLRASLEPVGPANVNVGETFVLRGIISTSTQVSNVFVKWTLPQGLELINGTLQNTINAIQPGQSISYELTLKKLTEVNDQVHLTVGSGSGKNEFADVAQYNTVDQERIKERVKRLVESNQRIIDEQRAESATKELKVFH